MISDQRNIFDFRSNLKNHPLPYMGQTDIQKAIQETISKIVHLDVVASQLKTSQQDLEQQYCLLYTSPSPRDRTRSRMPSSA